MRKPKLFKKLTWAIEKKSLVLMLHLAESWEQCPRGLYGHHCTWGLFLVLRLRWPPWHHYCGWICWDCDDYKKA